MLNTVKNFLKKYKIKNQTVLVGYSTGSDSTVLLYILNSLAKDFNLKITALHLNHGWRKEISDKDEKFARDFCKKINVDFISEKLDEKAKQNETTARDLRYDFFKRHAEKLNSKCVFLAHNKQDNVETAIYRIIKGTGLDGLCAISEHRGIFYRPLLKFSKEEIENFAKDNRLEFRFDKSNDDTKYNRNFIRHEILPLFEKINKTYLTSIDNLTGVARQEKVIVEDKIAEIWQKISKGDKIITEEFLNLKNEYQMKIIQNYVKDDLKNPKSAKIKQIVDFISKTFKEKQDPQFRKYKKFSINSKKFLYVNKKEFFKGE